MLRPIPIAYDCTVTFRAGAKKITAHSLLLPGAHLANIKVVVECTVAAECPFDRIKNRADICGSSLNPRSRAAPVPRSQRSGAPRWHRGIFGMS
jgi:hypothetical protein